MAKQKITNCLWFDSNAEEAIRFYTSVFKNSKINNITRYMKSSEKVSGKKEGTIMTINFTLNGQEFMALNGGNEFKFTEANSLVINCKDQKEVDYYWNKLSEGGDEKAQICGWLKDRYGLSWQITPDKLNNLLNSKNRDKSEEVMKALIKMKKLDIERLKKAYNSG